MLAPLALGPAGKRHLFDADCFLPFCVSSESGATGGRFDRAWGGSTGVILVTSEPIFDRILTHFRNSSEDFFAFGMCFPRFVGRFDVHWSGPPLVVILANLPQMNLKILGQKVHTDDSCPPVTSRFFPRYPSLPSKKFWWERMNYYWQPGQRQEGARG